MDPDDIVDDDRTRLVASLLRRAHEQSLESPEPAPFWREGLWRCEFHRTGGQDRLKVFQGDRCVHEEIVEGQSGARARCDELRHVLMREQDDKDSGHG
jgi:hypothetical protein